MSKSHISLAKRIFVRINVRPTLGRRGQARQTVLISRIRYRYFYALRYEWSAEMKRNCNGWMVSARRRWCSFLLLGICISRFGMLGGWVMYGRRLNVWLELSAHDLPAKFKKLLVRVVLIHIRDTLFMRMIGSRKDSADCVHREHLRWRNIRVSQDGCCGCACREGGL